VKSDGTLRVSVRAPAAGSILLEAFAKKSLLAAAPPKGTTRIARATAKAKKAGVVVLTLRPTGKGRAKLRRAHRLAVTLQVTFTPTGGEAAAPRTKKVTLKYTPK